MAVIDFKCAACEEEFFEIVNSANRDKIVCPKCGSKDIKQIFQGKCSIVGSNKGGGSCGGSCSGCSGCH